MFRGYSLLFEKFWDKIVIFKRFQLALLLAPSIKSLGRPLKVCGFSVANLAPALFRKFSRLMFA